MEGNKTTELRFIKFLRANKITGWRRHWPLFGHPDFVFAKDGIAVFIDGCFWHGCKKNRMIPKQNNLFWKEKIGRNIKRDRQVSAKLKHDGWCVVRIWEHELKNGECRSLYRIISIIE